MSRRWLGLALLLVSSGAAAVPPPAAPAADAATPASPAMRDARRYYERLAYDQALAALVEARREAAGDAVRLGECWLLEGYIGVALDRGVEARAAFRTALRLDPELEPPAGVSPKIRTLFDEVAAAERERRARHRAARLQPGPAPMLEVAEQGFDLGAVVEGMGAGWQLRLMVRDAAVGLEATLPMTRIASPHRTTAAATAAAAEEARFTVHLPGEFARPGATLAYRLELLDEDEVIARAPEAPATVAVPPHRAALRVHSPLAGAELEIDGQPAGRLPLVRPLPVEPGRRRVTLRQAGATASQEVEVRPGEVTTVNLAVLPGGTPPRVSARWGLLSGGAALLVAGAGLAGGAAASRRSLEEAVVYDPVTGLPTTPFGSVRDFERNARAFSTASIVSFVVGAVAVTTGALLFIRPPHARGEGKASSALRRRTGALELFPLGVRF